MSLVSLGNLLDEVIGESLRQILGERGAEIILRRIQMVDASWEGGPDRARVFSEVLRRVLGSGALAVERLILRRMYSELGLNLEQKHGYDFAAYVEELRRVWMLEMRE